MARDFTRVKEPVTYPVAYERVLVAMAKASDETLFNPSELAGFVWPGHDMSPQGAAFAVGKILRQMRISRLIRWVHIEFPIQDWGYRITDTGRAWLAQ